jgi:threonine/homoserine/homoserine lactone efflux protein
MPDAQHLLLFIAAGVLLNLTPGPDVLYIVSKRCAPARAPAWSRGWGSRRGASCMCSRGGRGGRAAGGFGDCVHAV